MKKRLKGFTLIELIIVMAIFSIILFGALNLIQPTRSLFTQANSREDVTASIDNISTYLDNSLRYAEVINIMDHEPTVDDIKDYVDRYYNGRVYCQKKTDIDKVGTLMSSELSKAAVKSAVKDRFYNAFPRLAKNGTSFRISEDDWKNASLRNTYVNANLLNTKEPFNAYHSNLYKFTANTDLTNPELAAYTSAPDWSDDVTDNGFVYANGKVYVLKIDNVHNGRISQKVYDYLAGDRCYDKVYREYKKDSDGKDTTDIDKESIDASGKRYFDTAFTRLLSDDDIPTLVKEDTAAANKCVINRAMYDNYSFNISLGMYTLNDSNNLVYDSTAYTNMDGTDNHFDSDLFSLTITASPLAKDSTANPRTKASPSAPYTYPEGSFTTNKAIGLINVNRGALYFDNYLVYDWKVTEENSADAKSYRDFEVVDGKYTGKYKFLSVKPGDGDPTFSLFTCNLTGKDPNDPVAANRPTADDHIAAQREPDQFYIIYSYGGQDIIKG